MAIPKCLPDIDLFLSLQIPAGSWFVCGSGPIVIRGIRQTMDTDISVTEEIFDRLRTLPQVKYVFNPRKQTLHLGSLDIDTGALPGLDSDDMSFAYHYADIIEGIPFLPLPLFIKSKTAYNRPKDQEDLRLLDIYLKNGGQ